MRMLRRGSPHARGAAKLEWILVVVVVGIAGLVAATLFGRRVATLGRAASDALDRGHAAPAQGTTLDAGPTTGEAAHGDRATGAAAGTPARTTDPAGSALSAAVERSGALDPSARPDPAPRGGTGGTRDTLLGDLGGGGGRQAFDGPDGGGRPAGGDRAPAPPGDRRPDAGPAPQFRTARWDPRFSAEDRRLLLAALERLPAVLQNLPIREIVWTDEPNAAYNGATQTIEIGRFALNPDGEGLLNDEMRRRTGEDAHFTLERILYHELLHGFHADHLREALEFIYLDSDRKIRALNRALEEDSDRPDSFQDEWTELTMDAAIAERRDGEDDMDVILRDPALRERLRRIQQRKGAFFEAHGIPSRWTGDTHAADQGLLPNSEYFAIAFEVARYDPDRFRDWRNRAADADPANDVLTPQELAWMDRHPELWREP